MLFGGIVTRRSTANRIAEAIGSWRHTHHMHAEMKWQKVSRAKYTEYASFVDGFFTLADSDIALFKCMVIDTHMVDYNAYHEGDKELGFYKFLYQFLLHKFARYPSRNDGRMVVFPHRRQTSYSLDKLLVVLNRGIRSQLGVNRDVVASIDPISAKHAEGGGIIQFVDVLTGAVGYQWNNCHLRPGASKPRVELAEYIAKRAGVETLAAATPYRRHRFEIWPFKLKKKSTLRPRRLRRADALKGFPSLGLGFRSLVALSI